MFLDLSSEVANNTEASSGQMCRVEMDADVLVDDDSYKTYELKCQYLAWPINPAHM